MDLWVVAAAAGAGYLAKYWQHIVRDREGSSEFPSRSSFHDNVESPSLIPHIHDKNPTRKLSPRDIVGNYCSESGNGNHFNGIPGEKSSKDGHIPIDDGNLPSSSIYPPEYRKYENFESQSGYVFDSDVGYMPEYNTSEMSASLGSRRRKKALRSKQFHLQYVKPRSSLDSCFTAHMQRESTELEEYLLSPLVSPCTATLRPFLVTDGRRVISRTSGSFSDERQKKVQQKANDGVAGVPALPQIRAANYSKEKLDKAKSRMGLSSNSRTSMQSDSQDGTVLIESGSSSGQVLFCLGISIGIMCSIIANKLEVEKLKDSLKQSENLVQDLQEELEMKDSLTVKELVYDDDSQDTHENLCCDKRLNMFSNQMNANVRVKCADEESVTLKEVESRSKIEAELEAELERLELSMIGSTLQGRLSDDIELDLEVDDDIIPELIHGELKADVIQRRSSSEPTSNEGTSSTSTPLSAKYGVSPRDLSLRLHEVIQSRLQDRIIELEEELAKTQKRVRDLESERINSWREVSNSESSSTMGSPVVCSPMTRPLIMTLSDAALDAYNEAYQELNNLKGSQNEAPLLLTDHSPQDNPLSTNQCMFDRQNGTKKMTSEGTPNLCEYKDDNDDDDDDDDDDLLLIKQIVEKARQGSPAVLRAQRAMVYLDG